MTDERLTPETLAAVVEEARCALADEPHGNVLLSCLLALIEERDEMREDRDDWKLRAEQSAYHHDCCQNRIHQ